MRTSTVIAPTTGCDSTGSRKSKPLYSLTVYPVWMVWGKLSTLRVGIALVLATAVTYGQDAAESRQSEIEKAREEKSGKLTPQRPPKNEEKFQRFTEGDTFNRILGPAAGLGVRLGGLPTGSGFALGPRYYRPDLLGENLVFKAWAVGSVSQFYETAMSLGLPHLLQSLTIR